MGVRSIIRAEIEKVVQAASQSATTTNLKGKRHESSNNLYRSGPILILTSYDSIEHPALSNKFVAKGITKYIAHEVPVDSVKKVYGTRFSIVLGDLSQTDDFRIMDIDGHHVFYSFPFEELGPPIYYPK